MTMITPQKALGLIDRHCTPLGSVRLAPAQALGHVLAADVVSPVPLPLFDNSAMDGYAIRSRDVASATPSRAVHLELGTTIYAGDTSRHVLGSCTARGIMTGAPLPGGADAIIPVEEAVVDEDRLVVSAPVERSRHVRRRGEEIGRGTRLLRRGDRVHPGSVACLAAVGRSGVRVIRKPVVSVITTGDETIEPGLRLARGQIYDSNSPMIVAALRDMGLEPGRVRSVGDRAHALSRAVGAALPASDVLIVVGGVSVGDRDHVKSVLERHRVRQVFWRVSQKPGKPLYFGVRGRRLVFGLPGNPASAFTCFYIYVYHALRRLAGHTTDAPARGTRAVDGAVDDPKKWRFLKATETEDGRVVAIGRQGSHMVTSLAHAKCLVAVPPGGGDRLTTYRLPYAEDDRCK